MMIPIAISAPIAAAAAAAAGAIARACIRGIAAVCTQIPEVVAVIPAGQERAATTLVTHILATVTVDAVRAHAKVATVTVVIAEAEVTLMIPGTIVTTEMVAVTATPVTAV